MSVVKGYTKKQLEDYANQRVVEELEDVYDNHTESESRCDFERYLNSRIRELKEKN